MTGSWVICEKSSRWAAALRTAISRSATERSKAIASLRICEVRGLDKFQSALDEGRHEIGLVEVRLENLPAILEWLSSRSRSRPPIVALVDETLRDNSQFDAQATTAYQSSTDALREAGALAVIDSLRRISELLDLTEALASTFSGFAPAAQEQPPFAEWAWSTLPWQDK